MTSKREQVLAALHAELLAKASVFPAVEVWRSLSLPDDIPSQGLIILRDGVPGEPEVTLSPLQYHYEHRAEVELFVQQSEAYRDTAFDALGVRVGNAIATDRTLGGLCDWVEAEAPVPTDLPVLGGVTIKAAVVAIILHYSTSDPLI